MKKATVIRIAKSGISNSGTNYLIGYVQIKDETGVIHNLINGCPNEIKEDLKEGDTGTIKLIGNLWYFNHESYKKYI